MALSRNVLLASMLVGTLTYAGCAKQQTIRKEESLAPATTAKAAEKAPVTAPPVVTSDATKVKSAPVAEQPMSASMAGDAAAKGAASAAQDQGAKAQLAKSLETIYFDFDSSTLSDTARQTLVKNLELLKKDPAKKVRVEGYCDERGSDDYNLALGERRAQAAARYLKSLGLSHQRVSVISFGNEKPVDQGHDEAAWSKNRRDEFVLGN